MRSKLWKNHFDQTIQEEREVDRNDSFRTEASTENIFISHCGRDRDRIGSLLFDRTALGKVGPMACFFYSKPLVDRGIEPYGQLVLTALRNCACALLIATGYARNHAWMLAEVDFLLDHRKPICVCRLDDVDPRELHRGLRPSPFRFTRARPAEIDFWSVHHDPVLTNIALYDLESWIHKSVPLLGPREAFSPTESD